jgi:hypothetical protein
VKLVRVVPKPGIDSNLKTIWKHVKYPGWIQWDRAAGGLLVAEIQSKVKGHEWQVLQAFAGYPGRYPGDQIESISVYYR